MKPRKQFDAERMYCPRCGDAYRLGIKNCAECKKGEDQISALYK